MPDWTDEAKKLADEHSDVADKGFDEAAKFADDKSGGKFDSQVQDVEHHAEGDLGLQGQDNSNQGNSNQDNSNQDSNQGN